MNTETDTFNVQVGVLKKIRVYRRALEDDDLANLPALIRLLHATLNAREILTRLHQGAQSKEFSKIGAAQRLQLLHFAELWGAAASDIEAMAGSFARHDLRPGSPAVSIVAATRERLAARASLTAGPIGDAALIPIGCACLAWTMPNRWGLRRTEDIPRLFNPLALAAHRPPFVVRMIAGDFEGYMDPPVLKTTLTAGGYEMVARADGGAIWNHCLGSFWSQRGFRQFIRIMSAHLDRFREEAFGETRRFRVFVLNLANTVGDKATRDQVLAVADALAGKVRGPHGVIGIDTNSRDERPSGLTQIATRVALVRAPPASGHQWWSPNYYNTPEGIEYESRIMKAMQACVAAWADPRG